MNSHHAPRAFLGMGGARGRLSMCLWCLKYLLAQSFSPQSTSSWEARGPFISGHGSRRESRGQLWVSEQGHWGADAGPSRCVCGCWWGGELEWGILSLCAHAGVDTCTHDTQTYVNTPCAHTLQIPRWPTGGDLLLRAAPMTFGEEVVS